MVQASYLASAGDPQPGDLCERIGTAIAVLMSRAAQIAAGTLARHRIDAEKEAAAHACSSRRTARDTRGPDGIHAVALGTADGGAFSHAKFSPIVYG